MPRGYLLASTVVEVTRSELATNAEVFELQGRGFARLVSTLAMYANNRSQY